MVKNKIVSSSHSKTEKMPISAKVLKWNAEHKNLSAIDALLNIKKVEGSELTDIFQEKKSDVKDLNIKDFTTTL